MDAPARRVTGKARDLLCSGECLCAAQGLSAPQRHGEGSSGGMGKEPPIPGSLGFEREVTQLELSFSFSVFVSPWITFIGFSQKLPLGLELLGRERCAGLFWF